MVLGNEKNKKYDKMVQNQINKTKRKNQTKQKKHIKTKRTKQKNNNIYQPEVEKGKSSSGSKILKWTQNIFLKRSAFLFTRKKGCAF